MGSFAVGETDFLLDGRAHRILSGAIHYFRVHPDLWADRIRKARLMGLNTIETYVAWNAHEPRRGEWDATGWNDLGRFLDLIAEEGMHAIVRPGPYICAEWHNGGLPVWLTGIPGIGLRRSEPQYLAEVQTYLQRVYEIVAPRQIDRGGPVTLVQIENEYGAYGDDKDYLRELVRVTRDAGITVPLTTIDQPTPQMLSDGSLEGLHATGSFGSRATERLAALRAHQHTGPLMCAEFWDGWFDWWGGHHHTTSVADAAGELESLLAAGASVNFYMFHGGTNFGLTNGANDKGRYLPLVTSYDYDAPLDEAGNPTEKYFAFRDVIARYAAVPDELPPAGLPAPAFAVELERGQQSLGCSIRCVGAQDPADLRGARPPERARAARGRPACRRRFASPHLRRGPRPGLGVGGRHGDRHDVPDAPPAIDHGAARRAPHARRRGAGPRELRLADRRAQGTHRHPAAGRRAARRLERPLRSTSRRWAVRSRRRSSCPTARTPGRSPCAARSTSTNRSTSSSTPGTGVPDSPSSTGSCWAGTGCRGPQRTLYVPAPILRAGENTVVVIELEHVTEERAVFVAQPELGPTSE